MNNYWFSYLVTDGTMHVYNGQLDIYYSLGTFIVNLISVSFVNRVSMETPVMSSTDAQGAGDHNNTPCSAPNMSSKRKLLGL